MRTQALESNKPAHYILDHGDYSKMKLFPKNVVPFGFFKMRWNSRFNNEVIVLNATSVLIFQENEFKNYYTVGQFQLLQRQSCERNHGYVCKSELYLIPYTVLKKKDD